VGKRARDVSVRSLKSVPPLYRLAKRIQTMPERIAARTQTMREQVPVVKRYNPRSQPLAAIRFVLTNREPTNFTYEIENLDELTDFLAHALDRPHESVAKLVAEIEGDVELEASLCQKLAKRTDRNRKAPYGRRIGWYVVTRIVKPKLAVETGTHDGLGASVILSALERNAREGAAGRLVSVDIGRNAGWLIPDLLRGSFEQRFEDSIDALRSIDDEIDLAVVDSAHAYEHERPALETIADRAHAWTIVISDNPGSRAFANFCASRGFRDYEFRERPRRHIYPGAGLALARFSTSQ